jgi:putative ABC transport system permease protein
MLYALQFYLRIALQNLVVHKARMALALLGILFAVMSLFAFGNISSGMKMRIDEEMARFGRNLVMVRSGIVFPTARGTRQFAESKTMKLEDATRISEQIPGVLGVVPFYDLTYQARYRDRSMRISLIGASAGVFRLRNVGILAGRIFTGDDEAALERKIVIGYKVYENLFGNDDPIGKHIVISRAPTEVIGVIDERGVDVTGQDQDIQAYIPLSTFMRRYSNVDHIKGMYVQVEEGVELEEMKERLRGFIRKLHKMRDEEKDDFTIFTQQDILRTREEGIRLVSTLTIIASTVSFIIGGLGIFAITLLSVTERKMEIGIRRVVGSRKRDIVVQFLMESAVTALVGGFLGLAAGLLLTVIVDVIGGIPFVISWSSLFAGLVACTLVGLLAGIYPALQGTKYEPIRALYA